MFLLQLLLDSYTVAANVVSSWFVRKGADYSFSLLF